MTSPAYIIMLLGPKPPPGPERKAWYYRRFKMLHPDRYAERIRKKRKNA